ncbi:hypothetical protein RUM43_001468 [Polyplax serrata]|uniref:Casein kinase 1 gamma C-terminal domain-containing protein n=1 Tax=Polyplax serrata TaxID=468196 RepID=A0AAN8XTZ2_POLSC
MLLLPPPRERKIFREVSNGGSVHKGSEICTKLNRETHLTERHRNATQSEATNDMLKTSTKTKKKKKSHLDSQKRRGSTRHVLPCETGTSLGEALEDLPFPNLSDTFACVCVCLAV